MSNDSVRTCSVKCGDVMEGWWRCGQPSVDENGRCAKHTFCGRSFSQDEARYFHHGMGVHCVFGGQTHWNYSIESFDAATNQVVIRKRVGHGKGGKKAQPEKSKQVDLSQLRKTRGWKIMPWMKAAMEMTHASE